ncbi:beta galactosidase jelly roll domain-containing protein [candidate division KSB1 bacterium]|nr:beta galactosidase jelly roll domain-containing protein [candidate division KSB1 bacterium]
MSTTRQAAIRTLFLLIVLIGISSTLMGSDRVMKLSLNKKWKFQIGNDPEYALVEYDDSEWTLIRPGRSWERQGYPGYDGYGWYRITFMLPSKLKNLSLGIDLGYIDDVDRVYVNGKHLSGKGIVDPYSTAFNVRRFYPLPQSLLKFDDENTIAIQVYDEEGDGGLVGGRVGIYAEKRLRMNQDLSGAWLFTLGDDMNWKESNADDSNWDEVMVPATWADYGYPDYDGYGWYRKTFVPDPSLKDEKVLLVLGKIDDIDEVYINGERIGRTGRFPGELYIDKNSSYFNQDRFYYITPNALKWDRPNTIAIRVYDVWQIGGIYEGPIGFVLREEYLKFKDRGKSSFGDFIERLIENWD